MCAKKTSDVHKHLNGSVSFRFLEETAHRNGCYDVFQTLVRVKQDYQEKTKEDPKDGYSEECLTLIWQQFSLIHQILRTLYDIKQATLDVIQSSDARYQEIRTTPKEMEGKSVDSYIDAFIEGLRIANNDESPGKQAFGLLSLNREFHTSKEAEHFIQRVRKSDGWLKGLDICGNPLAPRTLTGMELQKTITMALDAGIGLAIHMGEADTDEERQDTDTILTALENWVNTQPKGEKNPLHGRVRLGHCIFLTEEQRKKIRDLVVPIEICPTCHRKLNWHLKDQPHPVRNIYSFWRDPIVSGTDDWTVFDASAETEQNGMLDLFEKPDGMTRKQVKEHQRQFHFR